MATKPTIEEAAAMSEQFIEKKQNPKAICPRCKKKLILDDKGSGWTIHCEDESCLSATFRGL